MAQERTAEAEGVAGGLVEEGIKLGDRVGLITFARERLATYKCPRRVVVLEKLPRNAMGKVERKKLSVTQ